MEFRDLRKILKKHRQGKLEIINYIIAGRTFIATVILGFLGVAIAFAYGAISKKLSEAQLKISHKQRCDELLRKYNSINDLVFSIADLEDEVSIFKDKRKGLKNIQIDSFNKRVDKLKRMQNIMRNMYYVSDLIPVRGLDTMFSICVTNTLRARLYYSLQINRGYAVDTSESLRLSFDSIMYGIIDLTDTILPHLMDGWKQAENNYRECLREKN